MDQREDNEEETDLNTDNLDRLIPGGEGSAY